MAYYFVGKKKERKKERKKECTCILSESSRILLRKRKEEGGREGEGRNDEKVRLTRKTKTSLPFLQVFVQESGNISENILVLHISLPTICFISKNPMKK
jgi:hypothetical protein